MAFGRRKVQSAVGTATAADVLSGFSFSSAIAGINTQGLMPNQGQPILQPGASLTPGYYAGGQAATPGSGSAANGSPGSTIQVVVPSAVTRMFGILNGSGGGGGSSPNTTYIGGQGAAVAMILVFFEVTPGDTLSLTAPLGGGAGSSGNGGNGAPAVIASAKYGWSITSSYGTGGTAATSSADGSGGTVVEGVFSGSPPVIFNTSLSTGLAGSVSTSLLQGYQYMYNSSGFFSGMAAGSSDGAYGSGGGGGNDGDGEAGTFGAVWVYW